MIWKIFSQTGITVKMHTNHDGVWATAIMLRSIAASSSSRSPAIAQKKVSEITSTALRVNKELALISFPMRWVEGHISHSRLVLRRCHPQQPSCSREFGCLLFIKRLEQFVFVTWKPLLVFMSHNSTGFHWTFYFQTILETKKSIPEFAAKDNFRRSSKLIIVELHACRALYDKWLTTVYRGFVY